MRLILPGRLLSALLLLMPVSVVLAVEPFSIQVVERGTQWPVPLVQLRTINDHCFVTDNNGFIAIDEPELFGREVFFHLEGHGYEVPQDRFGYQGVRLRIIHGGSHRLQVKRSIIAQRIGRVTGSGLFAESQKLGRSKSFAETGVAGCDSIQTAIYQSRKFWLWGDTSLHHYPLGVFHCSGAVTDVNAVSEFKPPLTIPFDYFRASNGRPRDIAKMDGPGPTWLTGMVALPDKEGTEHLVAKYVKIKPPLESYQAGLCRWNDQAERFESQMIVWDKSEKSPKPPPMPGGHPSFWNDSKGTRYVLFGNPFPFLRCRATLEAWLDPSQWEELKPQAKLESESGEVTPHSGSITWHEGRKRWVTVFMQSFGKPSAFGELWYAESDSPTGPWGTAVKILSHNNYTFYNPRIHAEWSTKDSLVFEGTYTKMFANRPEATPRYDYNQMLYKLDLSDERLEIARSPSH